MQTATKLTFCRIFCAPIFFVVYFLPSWLGQTTGFFPALSVYIMIPLLALGEITDFLDGRYARKHGQVSGFGKVFDPFADVFLNITVFLCLVLSGYMPAFILLLIIYREFSMTFIRLVAIQQGVAIAARKGGKSKTFLYVFSCFYTLVLESCMRLGIFNIDSVPALKIIGLVLFGLCLLASYISFADYLINFRSVLVSKTTS
jgi:CDP-diacylglycerol--glycerol-3-phosphate 3-phosphatidyltransferase